jgi:hypothetical protein
MSVNKSFIILKGGIGNTRFYKRIGTTKNFAGNKGGPTKLEFQTLPSLSRMRQNASEAGVCFEASSILASFLYPKPFKKPQGQSRTDFMKILKSTFPDDTINPPGTRSLTFGQNPLLMVEGFKNKHFSENLFGNVCSAQYSVIWNTLPGTCGVNFPNGIYEGDWIKFPKSATHFRIFVRGMRIFDYIYNPTVQKYLTLGNVILDSAVSVINPIYPPSVGPFTVAYTDGVSMTSDEGMFMVMGVIFYQFINGIYNPLWGVTGDVVLNMGTP